jgi:microcystin-dependent protein
MAYEVRYTDSQNKGVIRVEDNTINQDTSLQLPGRFSTAYGQAVSENFLHILENFANSSAPNSPVEGQLWYDNTDGINSLKVYDGTSWLDAGGLKKSSSEPSASLSNPGDLWVDVDNQQLYLFTGSNWVLVGPEFSDGLVTGAAAKKIIGTDNIEYTVLEIDILDQPTAIISTATFTPKSKISGFDTISPGINLSTANIAGSGAPKFIGTSEQAEGLVVSGVTVGAENFLRGDTTSTTVGQIKVKNNSGVQIGTGGQLNLGVEGEAGVIQHNTSGSNIDFRVRDGNTTKTVIRIDSTTNVGINNLAPDEDLDVIGNIQVSSKTGDALSGRIKVESVVGSTVFGEGSIVTKGGVGIAENLNVGGSGSFIGNLETTSITPAANVVHNIGSNTLRYDQVYANTFIGNVQGNVSGTVSGRAGSADRLGSSTTFQMTGDVSAQSFAFDGQTGGSVKTFTTVISNAIISNKDQMNDVFNGDELLINKTQGDNQGLYRVSKQNFLKSIPLVPAGVISPYGGSEAPQGWLLCDGSILLKSQYNILWQAIGHNFLDPALLADNGVGTFALPDMRGRFPLGLDNMNDNPANRVTSSAADGIGNSLGAESVTITLENLPEHEHDLRGESGAQYYIIRDISGEPADDDAIQYDAPTGTLAGQALPSSGGVKTVGSLGVPLDVMNPYLALNYIIYTGQ